jgi:hypothetical protein
MYHIHIDGQQITDTPVSLTHVNNKYGGVKKLEASGHKLVPAKVDPIAKDEDKNVKIENALASQGKKTTIPHETHEALGEWWKQNKSTALTPDQHAKLKNIQDVKARRASMKVVKDCDGLEKSNYDGYNPTDNINRKANRTSETVDNAGKNKAVHVYTTSGSSMQSAHEDKQQKIANQQAKSSVVSFKDMSPEKQAELKAKYETKKSEEVFKAHANGQWSIEKMDECHDDPKHEAKEQEKAKDIKDKAQEILDLHKD